MQNETERRNAGLSRRRPRGLPAASVQFVLFLLLLLSLLLSFCIGRYTLYPTQILVMFAKKLFVPHYVLPKMIQTIVFDIRMPRVLTAMIIGAALSLSGATYQGLFKNPMVSPDILGASAGAGCGAAAGLLLGFNAFIVQLFAFAVGIAAVAVTYQVGRIIGKGNSTALILVLTGLVVSTLFSSFTSITKFVADPENKLPAITFWLMGGLSTADFGDVLILLAPMIIGAAPLILLRWKLNVLSFGDEEAAALGMNVGRLRLIMIACSTLITAASVAVGGMIGWVGLVIPHIARLLVGPNYKALLPASALLGGIFLLVADDAARCMFSTEIPLGILTSLIGAPFFLFMLMRGGNDLI